MWFAFQDRSEELTESESACQVDRAEVIAERFIVREFFYLNPDFLLFMILVVLTPHLEEVYTFKNMQHILD